jgi:ATP-dependent Clp protease adaptor protein ClpS
LARRDRAQHLRHRRFESLVSTARHARRLRQLRAASSTCENGGRDGITVHRHRAGPAAPMTDITTKPRTKVRLKTERPRLHKVILLNDDYTPREFVVTVLKGEFRMSEDQAYRVMMTAHRRGVCVVAVFTRDVAETKATRGTEAGRRKGYPLQFTTEPEE